MRRKIFVYFDPCLLLHVNQEYISGYQSPKQVVVRAIKKLKRAKNHEDKQNLQN